MPNPPESMHIESISLEARWCLISDSFADIGHELQEGCDCVTVWL